MKHISTLIILTLITFLSSTVTATETVTCPDGAKYHKRTTDAGEYEQWCTKGGDMHGTYLSYYKNGNKKAQADHRHGKKDGLSITWFESGQKQVMRLVCARPRHVP